MKYAYLKEFLPPYPEFDGTNRNWFFSVDESEIQIVENSLPCGLPSELVQFYKEIGYGSLYAPHNVENNYTACFANTILPPLAAASFYKHFQDWRAGSGLPIDDEDEGFYISALAFDIIGEGDLPFFEIMDSESFMVLKPHSDNPNAVWYMGQDKIEDSFEEFIRKLYFESPVYWEDKLS